MTNSPYSWNASGLLPRERTVNSSATPWGTASAIPGVYPLPPKTSGLPATPTAGPTVLVERTGTLESGSLWDLVPGYAWDSRTSIQGPSNWARPWTVSWKLRRL
ncbi:hypothetical protein IscW_ISCW015071 [Ixodes scapularis]|uniref:Uncharacterized protein n=1 Tax=Ixodes scapularis TaxID=6945 RepID=B7QM13_IXOSC|nr:hypothetical protein IscW_ISCW015071 [Ixodes scapularis]|eukprot:XP_002416218.1 hypothetical protein IscW_ISCW015071 [Ixodes scapularis]